MDEQWNTDAKLLNLRLQAERRTVQPDHDLMLWAHDEIERLRANLREIAERPQGMIFSAGFAPGDAEEMQETARRALEQTTREDAK